MEEPSQPQKRSKFLIAISTMMTICLLGVILIWIAPSNGSGLSSTYCAGVVTSPRFQIGAAWAHPLSSYLPPVMFSRYKVCIDLPASATPGKINGEFMLPP